MQDDNEPGKSLPPGDGGDDENAAPAQPGGTKPGHEQLDEEMGLDDGYELVTNGRRTKEVKDIFQTRRRQLKMETRPHPPCPIRNPITEKHPFQHQNCTTGKGQ